MQLNLKLKKSAGVKVTAAVHRLIRQGNAARDRHDPSGAASAYRAALAADPSLHHIHIQLGHMLKEDGQVEEAVASYEAALAVRPDDPEPLIRIAHLHKMQGDMQAAATCFLDAARNGDAEALDEVLGIMAPLHAIDRGTLYQALQHTPLGPPVADPAAAAAAIARVLKASDAIDTDDSAVLRSAQALLASIGAAEEDQPQAGRQGIVFDVSDLIAHFRHHRLPTGIQRVQTEVVMRALRDTTLDVRVCCFVNGRDSLLDIPGALFMGLATLSTAGKDAEANEWAVVKGRLFLHLLLADPFPFRHGDRLVNLGTSWWIYGYFLLVRNAKRDFGISYIPFVHDLIPIMAADHCVTGVIEDYVSWLVGVFDHADAFLVNSQSTGKDLAQAAERLGRRFDQAKVEIVPLDADFRQPASSDLTPDVLGRWDLAGVDYCLFVSTIESRKNHILALDAWARLVEEHGADAVPMLVCVGRKGWLNNAFFERLQHNPQLSERVLVIERVSDDELALLYRCCRFTLYPSHYEGWGLPVTESLCYGRVPVVADNSSLPEAGGAFALFFETNSVDGLVAALERILFEPGYREGLEYDIAAGFRPRSWASIATQITHAVAAVERNAAVLEVPAVETGLYYPTSLYKGSRIWRGLASGEVYRAGTGWLWPETFGSRTTIAGGQLLVRTISHRPLRLYLRLRGLDSMESTFVVSANDRPVTYGNLTAGEERWVLGDLGEPAEHGLLSILVRGGSAETIEVMNGGTLKRLSASIAVVGFALLERADETGRMRFVENAALAGLARINAYAERRQPDLLRAAG